MFEVRETVDYREWLENLRDIRARARIARRTERLAEGNFGSRRSVGDGVSELKIDYGPGYRVYFTIKGGVVVVLLCAGDKSSQDRDIRKAKLLKNALETDQWH